MPAESGVTVTGLRELSRAFRYGDREAATLLRTGFRQIAEPIRRESETLTGSEIRNMHRSPRWMKMRTGITRTLVYVAPRQRGVKGRGPNPRRRPNLANLMMRRAMEPALAHHEGQIVHEVEQLLDELVRHFDR